MQGIDVIAIGRQGVFSLEQARSLLPIIRRITQDYSHEVDQRIARLEALDSNQTELIEGLESEINELIQKWHIKIKKLGCVPKGLWIVDFDSGSGYYCWKYPETDIMYWHRYTDGFTKRVLVSQAFDDQEDVAVEVPAVLKKEALQFHSTPKPE